MNRCWWLLLALPLIACPSARSSDDDDGDDDDSGANDDDAADDDDATEGPAPAELATISGTCPAWDQPGQYVEFTSGGVQRRAIVDVPSSGGEGKPVLFFWHALGTDPQYWYDNFGLDGVAEAEDVVLIVPDSRDGFFLEWDWTNGEDLVAYDDLRACAVTELGADIRRVYTSGFSAGALWSTYLTMHRADTLAASLLMSGGVLPTVPGYPLNYLTPAATVPVLGTEGGPTDTYNAIILTINFQDAMNELADNLVADGHPFVMCRHTGGHTPPPGALSFGLDFLFSHDYGLASPFAEGGGDALNAMCESL